MQIISQVTSMLKIPPSDDASVQRSIQARDEERKRAEALGLRFDGDKPFVIEDTVIALNPEAFTIEQSLCDEAVDMAIETFGLDSVLHSVRMAAAANGVQL